MIKKPFVIILLALLTAFPAGAAELRVTINGVRPGGGELLIGLYDNSAGFVAAIGRATQSGLMADSGRLVGVSIRAKAGTQSTIFTQLPPGRYAVIVVHDENDDGRLGTNAIGVPTEGYGFSNDARGFLSAPSFDAAAMTIGNADVSGAIDLIYPRESSEEDRSDYQRYISAAPETTGR